MSWGCELDLSCIHQDKSKCRLDLCVEQPCASQDILIYGIWSSEWISCISTHLFLNICQTISVYQNYGQFFLASEWVIWLAAMQRHVPGLQWRMWALNGNVVCRPSGVKIWKLLNWHVEASKRLCAVWECGEQGIGVSTAWKLCIFWKI